MPAARRNPESIQQEIGPHFKVVAGQFPVNVQCLACKHEGARPFRYKQSTFQDHINSRKHQKNAKACNPVSFNDLPSRFDGGAPNDTNDDDDGPGFADDVALPRWYEGERVDAFWSIAEQRDDVIAGLEVELAELRREDEEMADAHRNITGHLLGQEEGAWGPFKDKGMFAALSFLLSPRQEHSLISLEHALGLAEALGAPHVPSINVCKKALARIYLAGKEKLVRSTDVEGNIFWRNSIAHLIRDDFGNSHVRAKMHLLPRRAPVVKELRDGAALAHNVDERTAAPMVRLANGKEFWIREVYEYGEQLPGDARSSQSIKAALSDQLDAAEKGRPHSDLTALRKETGVKDTLTTKHCDNLLDLRKDLRDQGRSRDEVDRIVSARRVEITVGHWYGPLLRLHGLPIEALHTWLLGPVKYLVAEVARTVKQTGALFREAATRISSVNLDGIGDSASLDGYYLLNNAGGLTGKDMRALAQVLWLALFPLREQGLIKESLWEACRWMGVVTRLILVEEIPRNEGDEYQRNFSTALSNFFAAMLNVDPKQLKSKRKYHLLTHLCAGISLYGPAKGFATERYESFNSVARNASMSSNRAAPSRDIALRLYGQELVRQAMLDDGNKDVGSLVRFAISFRDGALFQMYGMEARKKKAVPGYFQRQQVERTVVTKEHAQAAEHLFAEEYVASSEVEYCSLRFIVSPAHEHVYPDSFVQVNAQIPPQENDEGRMTTSVVRIIALFGDPVGLLDEHPEVAKEPLALVQPMFAAALDAHGVRSLIYGQGRFLIPFAAIRAKFNISHHCARHECPIVDTRQRRQEREIVNATSYEVVHDLDDAPQIAILNDALCRSGWDFHHIYSVLGQPRSFEDVIRNL
ncbi:unnamed protein product [Tilletia controversa]|nr:unnamed protein product [Tilletia controversa]